MMVLVEYGIVVAVTMIVEHIVRSIIDHRRMKNKALLHNRPDRRFCDYQYKKHIDY